jgi:hypothetical protein
LAGLSQRGTQCILEGDDFARHLGDDGREKLSAGISWFTFCALKSGVARKHS